MSCEKKLQITTNDIHADHNGIQPTSIPFDSALNNLLMINGVSTSTVVDSQAISDIYMKLYDYGVGIFHKGSGDFVYCYVCNNTLSLLDTLLVDHLIVINDIDKEVLVLNNDYDVVFSFNLGGSKFQNSISIDGYSWHLGFYNPSVINSTFVNTLDTETILGKVNCQCVHNTSTPCAPSGGDAAPCDIGGEGATSCSVSSEAGGGVSVVGNGGNVSSGSGCSISCGQNFYACCHW